MAAPLAPQNVWLVSKTNHRVMSWDFVTLDVLGNSIYPKYNIYRSQKPNGLGMVLLATVDEDVNEFVDFAPRNDIFYYKIVALQGATLGLDSSLVTDFGFPNMGDASGEEFLTIFSRFDDGKMDQGRFGQ